MTAVHTTEIDALDEQARIAGCAKERIRQPNEIQPHGMLIALDPKTLKVVAASVNVEQTLGLPATQLINSELTDVDDIEWPAAFLALLKGPESATTGSVRVELAGRSYDAIVHPEDDLLFVELESSTVTADLGLLPQLYASISRLSTAKDLDQLRATAAEEIRQLTGFDRSMIYTFHPDGHGEVVAESRTEELEPFLGLHYPASDIPNQARELYLRKTCRHVSDADYEAVPIIPDEHPLTGEPIDLGMTELRSLSPHHRRFMLNMGTRASLSISLISDGRLIGLISCNHRTPLHIPHVLRRGCEMIAQQLSLQLGAIEKNNRLTRQLQVQHVRTELIEQMIGADDIAAGLVDGPRTLLDLVEADGAAVYLHHQLNTVGTVPSDRQITSLVAAMHHAKAGVPVISDQLPTGRPDLAELVPDIAGVVMVRLGADGDCIVWFRGEVAQSVSWLGDQTASNRATPFSPRNSFRRWKQAVTGRSLPWDDIEVAEAAELRRDIDNLLLRRVEAQLAHLGMHDALTGLPNRRMLMEALERALHGHAHGVPVALLFIDLDRFKLVNDSYGHDVGDALLIEAGTRITAAARSTDTVARLGGDEFMVLCDNTDSRGAAVVADRIVAAFQQPMAVDDRELHVTASVGITTAQTHHSAADLLREADTAMYKAKDEGRNQASNFEAGFRHQAMRRLDIEGALRNGLKRGELTVHYQPIRRMSRGTVCGVEALLRWERPGHGMVSPAEFIPLAEDIGFIVPLGQWVLDQSLHQLGRWKAEGITPPDFYVSVNLSPRQLIDPTLVDMVKTALAEQHISPSELTFEITETTLMSERSAVTDAVHALVEHGASISIDDFGTGYSSLSHLRHLPVAQLKVDRSFVAGLTSSARDHALVGAVIGLAHEFGMTCVGEGVETPLQLTQLEVLGCDFAQGYLLGRPGPPETLAAAMNRRL